MQWYLRTGRQQVGTAEDYLLWFLFTHFFPLVRMPVRSLDLPARTTDVPTLMPVAVADLTARQLALMLFTPPAHLLVDCGGLLVPHPLGVCRFVAQLLELHRRGTYIGLCNVHPGLHRYLQQLNLTALFHLSGQAPPTGTVRKQARP